MVGIRVWRVAVLCLLVCAQAYAQSPGRADTRTWYQAYQDGRRQVQRGEWQAAIASLQQAKRTGPRPGRRIPFYGDVFDDFLPDYYLGLTYMNTQQYKDASAAFEAVRQAGLITAKDREYGDFTKQSARATSEVDKQPLAQVSPPTSAPTQTPAQTASQTAARTIEPAQASNQPGIELPRPSSPFNPTQSPIQGPAPQTSNTSSIGGAPNAPTGTSGVEPPPTKAPPRARSQVTVDKGIIRNVRDTTPPAVIRALRLESALRAFFVGDYRQAFTELSAPGAGDSDPRASFYLACSSAALVLTGGVSGDEAQRTLDSARGRFAQLNAAEFAADERYVSPRVLQTLRAER